MSEEQEIQAIMDEYPKVKAAVYFMEKTRRGVPDFWANVLKHNTKPQEVAAMLFGALGASALTEKDEKKKKMLEMAVEQSMLPEFLVYVKACMGSV